MSSENSKPEWFQMAEADAIPPQPKGKRAIRMMALATPLLVLGAGLVFAQTQDSPIAVASAVASPAAPSADPIALANTPAPSAQATTSAPASTPVTTAASTTIQVSQTSPVTQSPSITIKKPSIATLPTGGGDDEGVRDSDDD